METNVFKFLYNLANTLKGSMQDVYNWLVTEITFLGTTYSMYEVLFGGALVLVLGYAAIKFVVGLFG